MASDMWNVGKVSTKATGFGPGYWLEQGLITIRPDESLSQIKHRWAKENGYKASDVRITIVER